MSSQWVDYLEGSTHHHPQRDVEKRRQRSRQTTRMLIGKQCKRLGYGRARVVLRLLGFLGCMALFAPLWLVRPDSGDARPGAVGQAHLVRPERGVIESCDALGMATRRSSSSSAAAAAAAAAASGSASASSSWSWSLVSWWGGGADGGGRDGAGTGTGNYKASAVVQTDPGACHIGQITSLVALRHGGFASGSVDGTAKIWDERGSYVETLSHGGGVNAVIELADGSLLTAGIDRLRLWARRVQQKRGGAGEAAIGVKVGNIAGNKTVTGEVPTTSTGTRGTIADTTRGGAVTGARHPHPQQHNGNEGGKAPPPPQGTAAGGSADTCYIAYCNSHADLKDSFCEGAACNATNTGHVSSCMGHWDSYGKKEHRNPDPLACVAAKEASSAPGLAPVVSPQGRPSTDTDREIDKRLPRDSPAYQDRARHRSKAKAGGASRLSSMNIKCPSSEVWSADYRSGFGDGYKDAHAGGVQGAGSTSSFFPFSMFSSTTTASSTSMTAVRRRYAEYGPMVLERTLRGGHNSAVLSLAEVDAGAGILASGDAAGTINLWERSTGHVVATFSNNAYLRKPDGGRRPAPRPPRRNPPRPPGTTAHGRGRHRPPAAALPEEEEDPYTNVVLPVQLLRRLGDGRLLVARGAHINIFRLGITSSKQPSNKGNDGESAAVSSQGVREESPPTPTPPLEPTERLEFSLNATLRQYVVASSIIHEAKASVLGSPPAGQVAAPASVVKTAARSKAAAGVKAAANGPPSSSSSSSRTRTEKGSSTKDGAGGEALLSAPRLPPSNTCPHGYIPHRTMPRYCCFPSVREPGGGCSGHVNSLHPADPLDHADSVEAAAARLCALDRIAKHSGTMVCEDVPSCPAGYVV